MTGLRLTLCALRTRLRNCEKGQALVELAITLPVLFLLVLGGVEMGRFAYLAIEISSAAKAAAQYGSQNSVTAADVSGMQAAAAQDAPEVAAQCTNFATTINPGSCACVGAGSSTSAACGSTCAHGYLVQNLSVTTSAQCAPIIYPSGFGGTITLSGRAVQEVLK